MTNLLRRVEPFEGSKYYYDSKLNATLHTNSNGEYDYMWPWWVLNLHNGDFVTSLALPIASKEVLLTSQHIFSPQFIYKNECILHIPIEP